MTNYDIRVPTLSTLRSGRYTKCAWCADEYRSGAMFRVRINSEEHNHFCSMTCLDLFLRKRKGDEKSKKA